MKHRILALIFGITLMASTAIGLLPAQLARAATPQNIPGDPNTIAMGVVLGGVSNPTTYTVTGTRAAGNPLTIPFTFKKVGGVSAFYSIDLTGQNGVGQGVPCSGTPTSAQIALNRILITVSTPGAPAGQNNGTGEFNLCNKQLGFIYFITVATSPTAQQQGCLTGSIPYTDSQGNPQPFKSSTNATLKGGPNNHTYTVTVNDNGQINNGTPFCVPAGNYTLIANYTPPSPPADNFNHTYNWSGTLGAGQTVDLGSIATNTPPGGTTQTTPTCEASGFSLSWILCPVFNGVASFTDWIFTSLIQPLLATTPISTNPKDATYQIWSNFRIYGNIILVVAVLVIAFAETIGGGLIEAYTVHKMLPRILIAVILINLSVYIVAFLVDLTNIIGAGIGTLMTAPLANAGQFKFALGGGQSAAIILGTGGSIAGFLGAVAFGPSIVASAMSFVGLFVLLPAVLGLLAAFVTIIIRKALILFLVLVSPVAFALYALPNTEKYFRKWWDFLFETLLVYPIIVIIFAVADILSVTIMKSNGINGDAPLLAQGAQAVTSPLAALISFICLFLPLVFIPYAFRLAGGAVGKLHENLTNYHRKGQEAIKGNVNDPNSLRNRTKRNMNEALTRGQNQVIQAGGHPETSNRRQRARSRFSNVFGNLDSRMSNYNRQASERMDQLSATGDDTLVYAGAGWEENGKYFNSKGREITAGRYHKGKSLYGNSQHSAAQALGYTLRKAQTDKDEFYFRKAFTQNAVANNWNNDEISGVWAAATYPYKTSHASEWYSKPEAVVGANGKTSGVSFKDISNNEKNYGGFIGDMHKVRQSFELGKVRDVDWRAMADHQSRIAQKIGLGKASQEELVNYAQTSEVVDAMVHKGLQQGYVTQDTEGNISVSGASAAAQPVIEAMYDNRKYGVKQSRTPTGDKSSNVRDIYDIQAVRAERDAANKAAPPNTRPNFNEEASQVANRVAQVEVTGDEGRTAIPRRM